MGGGDRRGAERFKHEVAVRHAVERIGGRAVEAQSLGRRKTVNRKRGAGQRRRAKRTFIEPNTGVMKTPPVAADHLDIGKKVMAESHRLGRLQMGEAGHDRVGMRPGLFNESLLQVGQLRVDFVDRVAHPEAEVDGHLVIARPGGM